jgi:hypothetical protein
MVRQYYCYILYFDYLWAIMDESLLCVRSYMVVCKAYNYRRVVVGRRDYQSVNWAMCLNYRVTWMIMMYVLTIPSVEADVQKEEKK